MLTPMLPATHGSPASTPSLVFRGPWIPPCGQRRNLYPPCQGKRGPLCFLGCSALRWSFKAHLDSGEKLPPPPGARLSSEPAGLGSGGRATPPRVNEDLGGVSPDSSGERGGEGGQRGRHLPREVSAPAACHAPSGRPGRSCRPGLCSAPPDAVWGEPGARGEKDHSS